MKTLVGAGPRNLSETKFIDTKAAMNHKNKYPKLNLTYISLLLTLME